MFSDTDALFTLHTSTSHSSESFHSKNVSSLAVTGVCFVRDHFHITSPRSININDDDDDDDDNDNSADCRSISLSSSSSSSSSSASSSSSSSPLLFKCSTMLLGPKSQSQKQTGTDKRSNNHDLHFHSSARHLSAASHRNLQGSILASCHHDGSCKLWDLASRRCLIDNIVASDGSRKFGLAVRRLSHGSGTVHNSTHPSQFLYQTRDPYGTVTLHDLNHDPCLPVLRIQTGSTTFCSMSPCQIGSTLPLQHFPSEKSCDNSDIHSMGGERNLVALPTESHSMAIVRDLRCDPTASPAFRISIDGCNTDNHGDRSRVYGRHKEYGMLTSLALCLQHTTHRIVLGCGMEDGSALFYDLGGAHSNGHHGERYFSSHMPWQVDGHPLMSHGFDQNYETSLPLNHNTALHDGHHPDASKKSNKFACRLKLGNDPILSLDLTTSYAHGKTESPLRSTLVAVAGCAGDADILSDLPEHERGTVSTIKVSLADEKDDDNATVMKASMRSRTQTCSYSSGGKPGVSIVRFRPDGRIFAVGGWDRRLRIYGRTSSKPLAILRGGHSDSVVAMDWAENAAVSGLLATAAADGRICVYRVFPHTLKCIGSL